MPKEFRVEHSDLFSQRAEAVEHDYPAQRSDQPVQNPVFSDREDYHPQHHKPASS